MAIKEASGKQPAISPQGKAVSVHLKDHYRERNTKPQMNDVLKYLKNCTF